MMKATTAEMRSDEEEQRIEEMQVQWQSKKKREFVSGFRAGSGNDIRQVAPLGKSGRSWFLCFFEESSFQITKS